jgi:hypothetical protein
MDAGHAKAFAILALVGVACGVIVSILCRGFRKPFLWTVIWSGVSATVASMVLFAAWVAIEAMVRSGRPLNQAVVAGLIAAIVIALAAPYASGGPAAIVGVLLQIMFQRRLKSSTSAVPPPFPNATR